jgi:hypothetical protein
MKYLKLITIAILLYSCADDNNIRGQVLNKNQQPIDSVKVMVSGTDIFTYSNNEGVFEINTNDLNDELMFEKEGYQLKYQIFDDSTDNKIVLEK